MSWIENTEAKYFDAGGERTSLAGLAPHAGSCCAGPTELLPFLEEVSPLHVALPRSHRSRLFSLAESNGHSTRQEHSAIVSPTPQLLSTDYHDGNLLYVLESVWVRIMGQRAVDRSGKRRGGCQQPRENEWRKEKRKC